jgi:hypothetical protein
MPVEPSHPMMPHLDLRVLSGRCDHGGDAMLHEVDVLDLAVGVFEPLAEGKRRCFHMRAQHRQVGGCERRKQTVLIYFGNFGRSHAPHPAVGARARTACLPAVRAQIMPLRTMQSLCACLAQQANGEFWPAYRPRRRAGAEQNYFFSSSQLIVRLTSSLTMPLQIICVSPKSERLIVPVASKPMR